jgi:hypothetical protein
VAGAGHADIIGEATDGAAGLREGVCNMPDGITAAGSRAGSLSGNGGHLNHA